jgi:hypothetical protein
MLHADARLKQGFSLLYIMTNCSQRFVGIFAAIDFSLCAQNPIF